MNGLRKYDEAIKVLDKAILLNPNISETHLIKGISLFKILGNSYYGLKKFDEAIIIYDKALEINPYLVNAYS